MANIANPFEGNIPKTMSDFELSQALRTDIADELEAIILYEAHANATTDPRAKKILLHIADEERRHVGEFQQMLYLLSNKDAEFTEQGKQKIQEQQQQNFQSPMN